MERLEKAVLFAVFLWLFIAMPFRIQRDLAHPELRSLRPGAHPAVYIPFWCFACVLWAGIYVIAFRNMRIAATRKKMATFTSQAEAHLKAGRLADAEAALERAKELAALDLRDAEISKRGILVTIWQEFLSGFIRGYGEAAKARLGLHLDKAVDCLGGTGKVEALCRQNGWRTGGRTADGVAITFKDEVIGTRDVLVDEGVKVMAFSTMSASSIRVGEVPDQLFGCLLGRNATLTSSAWRATASDRGRVVFALAGCSLFEGLTAAAFRCIVQEMLSEAQAVDALMVKAGLLSV